MLQKFKQFFIAGFTASYVIACTPVTPTEQKKQTAASVDNNKVKNVILMIGDGMGPQQVGLLEEFASRATHSPYQNKATALATFASEGTIGLSKHGPIDALVVDSACSATQLAIGFDSDSEMIGLDANGNVAKTVLEYAKEKGKATGLVSDTRLTHATPASFAAHQPHRSLENEIAADMLLTDDVDVMLSGGLRHFIPKDSQSNPDVNKQLMDLVQDSRVSLRSKRKDNVNLLADAKGLGYQLAFTREQLLSNTNYKAGDKLLGLFASSGMEDGIAYKNNLAKTDRLQPSLKEMTMTALDILSKDEDGFFLMVEGGQIDWAGHANDAGTLLHEMLKFDEAIQAVHEWVKNRNDTLVVITADHETGGFGFSYSRKDILPPSDKPGDAFKDMQFHPHYNFGRVNVLDKLYQQNKNFYAIWSEAVKNGETIAGENGDSRFPTPESMMAAMNANNDFKISLEEASRILEKEENNYHVHDHKYLSATEFPKIDDFEEFYIYGDDIHKNLMGRALSKHQSVVWSTGTHTHTPVMVVAWGPEELRKSYSQILHHTDIGKMLIETVTQ